MKCPLVEISLSAMRNTLTLMPNRIHSILKASLIGGFFIAVLSLLSACERMDHSDKMVFRYNEPSGIPTLDPAFARDKSTIWAVGQLYDGLFYLDENNEVQPALATGYVMEGSTYTFSLRKAYFHSGRRIKAQDVRYSLQRLLDPKVASPGAWVLERVSNIDVLNDSTVAITLDKPFAAFPSMLTMPYCSVVDSIIAAKELLATTGGGSGPFKFHQWHFGEKMVFHKNENYWQKDDSGNSLPYLDGLSISFLPDQQSAFLEYLTGTFDLLPNIDPSFKDDLLTQTGELRNRYRENHVLNRTPFLNTEFLLFNSEYELPYELRWALNAAINRTQMMELLRSGIGREATGGIIPFGLPGHQQDIGISFSPDSAKKVLAAFDELPELTLTTSANYRDICEFVQGNLGDLGWSISVDIVPSATLRSAKSSGSLAFFRASWIADYPDAENYLLLFYSKMCAPKGPNYSRYSVAAYDSLYESLLNEQSASVRTALAQEADALLMKNAACVPLYYDEVIRVHSKNLKGLKTNALNALLLKEVILQ
ncbi:ABC transporter substrate-binding protein [Schleiferiaceae bacterium]|nr:ABC transporter substrate-binding protein [Schleiferiaceae bacterium]MDB2473182.1 ABC transporter substrate-binding protein [Schleiferiaceae bacterium]